MLAASIQVSGEPLSAVEVQDICDRLREDGVRLLSVRGCRVSDRDFGRLCRGVAASRCLAQLNLNLGVVSSIGRARHLADALAANRSLQTLFLHGSPLLDAGLEALNPALAAHPALVCLDLGDCLLGDAALALICGMLPPDGAKSGLRELTLSANPRISTKAWARFSVAVAHSSQLRVLNLDYNPLGKEPEPEPEPGLVLMGPVLSAGDQIASMLAVAVASSRTLEVLDLEGTGLTHQSAQVLTIFFLLFLLFLSGLTAHVLVLVLVLQVFLDMVENYPTCLRVLVLAENKVSPELQQQISDLLSEGEEDGREAPPPPPGHAPSCALQPIREKPLPWLPNSNSGPPTVMLTSGVGESLLAENER
ncbi:leucine-rich repeat-containing protein 73-like isoform X1 [Poeciliopsis prolifica]|uniref:leucine-rich repeat-containing protein 73-like isoform X1 n=1 Tax=Poeciliopsis prolifica TaxID=188132 RepID=UPI0024145354|nr:leucine-rich repeat-containing protein 73-like isoform X1 [Poeciliopsis prolifica]